jgi:hypothetical protein
MPPGNICISLQQYEHSSEICVQNISQRAGSASGAVAAGKGAVKAVQEKNPAAQVAGVATGASGGAAAEAPSAEEIAARQAEVREWVDAWKDKTGGVKSGAGSQQHRDCVKLSGNCITLLGVI